MMYDEIKLHNRILGRKDVIKKVKYIIEGLEATGAEAEYKWTMLQARFKILSKEYK